MDRPAPLESLARHEDAGPTAFLGVERSVTGRRWELRRGEERTALALSQRHGLPDVVGRALAARGVTLDGVEDFLNPSLRRLLPDPAGFADMDAGVDRLVRAVENKESVAVFGDYDVDGATSSALLKRYFDALGAPLVVYIPDRIAEGYGPNLPALRRLRAQGVDLVVTVDCGVSAHEALSGARDTGLDVIVVDHHAAEATLPPAVAIINPNRLDDTSGQGQLAAVGVTFLLLVALTSALRSRGHFGDRQPPDLLGLLDLVALGTVCDVVPLSGVNRAFVIQGLKVMAQRRNPGLAALSDAAGIDEPPGAYHLGFVLGPRVNAGGRVGDAGLGAALLAGAEGAEAAEISRRLDALNRERQAIEAECLEQAIATVEEAEPAAHLVCAAGEGWHPGVIGIVASRLKDRYNRPACVVALENGVGKGSGRSVDGVDFGAAVIAARQSGLLMNGGGHRMAAGFTVAADRLAEFQAFLAERIAGQLDGSEIVPRMRLDGALTPAGASLDLIVALERLAPFGVGNAEPRFALTDARIAHADVVGRDHVRCRIAGAGGGDLKAIAFRVSDTELGAFLLSSKGGAPINLAGRLRIDRWQGRETPQLLIDDAAEVRQGAT